MHTTANLLDGHSHAEKCPDVWNLFLSHIDEKNKEYDAVPFTAAWLWFFAGYGTATMKLTSEK